MTLHTDIALVGAGPIGIEMAVALKRSGLEYLHFEAGCIGGTIAWYAPGTAFFSSPERLALAGVPFETGPHYKATREEYLHYLRMVVKQFDLQIETYRRLIRVERDGEYFNCHISASSHSVGGPEEAKELTLRGTVVRGGFEVRAKRVILATGDMQLPRALGIPGEDKEFVSHYLRDPHYYAGRHVLVVGGANSAVEAALRLYRVGSHVTLIHRGEGLSAERIKPWLLPELRALIRENKISFRSQAVLKEIGEREAQIQSGSGEVRIRADFVLLMTGYVQDSSLFEQFGISLHGPERAPRLDPSTFESDVPGVFVIGTAVAGTQFRAKHFIETSHIHVNRVIEALGVSGYPDYSERLRPVDEREM